jgi:hypothetical protein
MRQKTRSHLPASLKDFRRDCKLLSLLAAREVTRSYLIFFSFTATISRSLLALFSRTSVFRTVPEARSDRFRKSYFGGRNVRAAQKQLRQQGCCFGNPDGIAARDWQNVMRSRVRTDLFIDLQSHLCRPLHAPW